MRPGPSPPLEKRRPGTHTKLSVTILLYDGVPHRVGAAPSRGSRITRGREESGRRTVGYIAAVGIPASRMWRLRGKTTLVVAVVKTGDDGWNVPGSEEGRRPSTTAPLRGLVRVASEP